MMNVRPSLNGIVLVLYYCIHLIAHIFVSESINKVQVPILILVMGHFNFGNLGKSQRTIIICYIYKVHQKSTK